MTKTTLFDRLNQELEAFGKKAQAALDEGKVQIELLRRHRAGDTDPEVVQGIHLSINGIAAGLRNSG